MKKLAKVAIAVRWAVSPDGRKEIGALAGIVVAIYTALHRAGI